MTTGWHFGALFGALLCVASTPASAELGVCNRTSYVLYAATAAVTAREIASEGWTRIVPGDCRTVLPGTLTGAAHYLYARSSQAHSGLARAWGGDRQICVRDVNFATRAAASAVNCQSDDFYTLPFAKIDSRHATSWISTLSETPAIATLMDARIAGLKRLLHDLGYAIPTIDGHPDKGVAAALDDFRKRQHLPGQVSASNLFDALETSAFKVSTPAGYSVCNDTTKSIAVALGEKAGATWISHGWWKIVPGSCAKAVTTPLATDSFYLYALRIDGHVLVGGSEKFCVADIEFDIQGRTGCKNRGLGEAGFAQTPVRGLSGFAAHVGETGLVASRTRSPSK